MAADRLPTFLEANLTLLGKPFEAPASSPLPPRALNAAVAQINEHLREAGQEPHLFACH